MPSLPVQRAKSLLLKDSLMRNKVKNWISHFCCCERYRREKFCDAN